MFDTFEQGRCGDNHKIKSLTQVQNTDTVI